MKIFILTLSLLIVSSTYSGSQTDYETEDKKCFDDAQAYYNQAQQYFNDAEASVKDAEDSKNKAELAAAFKHCALDAATRAKLAHEEALSALSGLREHLEQAKKGHGRSFQDL